MTASRRNLRSCGISRRKEIESTWAIRKPKTTILAPHGGGIEPGTSELCLAVAGYHPASLPQIPAAGVTYDYWIFEGLRDSGNPELHVTSTGCDDGVAVSLCAGSLNALALHGLL